MSNIKHTFINRHFLRLLRNGFEAQKRSHLEKNISVEETTQQAIKIDNVAKISLQNLDENINIKLENIEKDSQKIWT